MIKGGSNSLENCVLTCPECNMRIGDGMMEYEFVLFLTEILERCDSYKEVIREVRIGSTNVRADIIAIEIVNEIETPVLIEVKSFTSFTSKRFYRVLSQLLTYSTALPDFKIILALPGELDEKQYNQLSMKDIEVWDQQTLSSKFKKEILSIKNPRLDSLLQIKIGKTLSLERQYIQQLKKVNPGWADWSIYQKLVGNILELLFCPPLFKPLIETSDKSGTNKRDFIFPNYASDGPWDFIRDKYSADFIVVDAKNYVKGVNKRSILQLSNYLKKPGAGLFGIIVSRNQEKKNASQTILEKWLLEEKMILVLTDDDVERMLIEKTNDRDPGMLILQKIEDFRLSI